MFKNILFQNLLVEKEWFISVIVNKVAEQNCQSLFTYSSAFQTQSQLDQSFTNAINKEVEFKMY